MVSFDSAIAGTSRAVWDADPRLATVPQLSLDHVDRVIVVAAHPDDETLGAGGLIATCSAAGIPVEIVIVTDGSASHPHSPTHSPAQLAELRRREATAALALLAPDAAVRFLEVPDGGVSERQRLLRRLLLTALASATGHTLVVAPWRGDGHRDHRLVGEACASIAGDLGAQLLEYPVWMWHWAGPGDDAVPWSQLTVLPLPDEIVETKRRAIQEHRSQVAPLSERPGDEPVLLEDFLTHFDRPHEFFFSPSSAVPIAYFDEKYAHSDDPWGFTTRWYERRKRELTLASLPDERYESALEIGCSIGTLTEQLAPRCDRLLAVDHSEAAITRAREKLKEMSNVTIEKRDVGEDFPRGSFNLVVLSEVGYYFDPRGLEVLLDAIEAGLDAAGTLVACHWRHPVAEHPLTGDVVHEAIHRRTTLHRIALHLEEDFVLETFSRDARSVATRTGLA